MNIHDVLDNAITALITGIATYFVASRKMKKDEFKVLFDEQKTMIDTLRNELKENQEVYESKLSKLQDKVNDLRISIIKLTDGITGLQSLPFPAWIKKFNLSDYKDSIIYCNPEYYGTYDIPNEVALSTETVFGEDGKKYNELDIYVIENRAPIYRKLMVKTKRGEEEHIIAKWPIYINTENAFVGGLSIPCRFIKE